MSLHLIRAQITLEDAEDVIRIISDMLERISIRPSEITIRPIRISDEGDIYELHATFVAEKSQVQKLQEQLWYSGMKLKVEELP